MVSKDLIITWAVFLLSVVPLFAQTTGTFHADPSLPAGIQALPGVAQDSSDTVVIAPNPFTSSTAIYCMVPLFATVELKMINIRGMLVDRLRRERIDQGFCRFNWKNGSSRPGPYFVLVRIGDKTYTNKIILVK